MATKRILLVSFQTKTSVHHDVVCVTVTSEFAAANHGDKSEIIRRMVAKAHKVQPDGVVLLALIDLEVLFGTPSLGTRIAYLISFSSGAGRGDISLSFIVDEKWLAASIEAKVRMFQEQVAFKHKLHADKVVITNLADLNVMFGEAVYDTPRLKQGECKRP